MFWKKAPLYLLFFPVLSLLFFYPTYKYGYVTDFLSWLYKYENGSWSDIADCFDYPGLHHFFHLVNFTVFKIVGKSFFGWYLVLSILHGINGALVFVWMGRLVSTFKIENGRFIKWFIPLIFMLSPYSVEPVVWKACLHYLLSLGLIVGGLIYLTDYLEKNGPVWKVHFCFLLALLTLEISLAVPFIYLIYWVSFEMYHKTFHWRKRIVSITVPQIGIITSYFLANKYFLGGWVGHYGEESHLNFDLPLMCGTAFQYLGKYSFFLHYLPFKVKIPIYNAIVSLPGIGLIFLFSATMIFYLFRKSIKEKMQNSVLIIFSYLAFFMALFPISNLFFFNVQIYENDRYGYLASLFFYLFIGLVINKISGVFRWITAALFALAILFTGIKTISMAHTAGEVTHAMVANFDYYDKKEIVFLSKPDNLGGMQLFRDLSGEARSFTESLYHFQGKKYDGKIEDLAQINILSPNDKVKVAVIDSFTLKVKNPQNGSWFWRDGMGLIDYETEDYKITKHGWYYLLKRKVSTDNKTYLINNGLQWEEVDWY